MNLPQPEADSESELEGIQMPVLTWLESLPLDRTELVHITHDEWQRLYATLNSYIAARDRLLARHMRELKITGAAGQSIDLVNDTIDQCIALLTNTATTASDFNMDEVNLCKGTLQHAIKGKQAWKNV